MYIMIQATEYTLVEKPCIDALVKLGYTWLPPQQNQPARDTLNQVILRDIFITAIQRINDVPEEVARATYQDMLIVTDNEQWTNLLRGNYSRNVPGETTKKTIRLIDFLEPENNTFTITNQFYVKAQNPRKPDIVIFINGIPLVVLEAKNPLPLKTKPEKPLSKLNNTNAISPACSTPTSSTSSPMAQTSSTAQQAHPLPIGEPGKAREKQQE